MRRLLPIVIAIAIFSLHLHFSRAQPPTVATPVLKPLMQLKLDKSKAILEGLTLGEYEKVSKNARSLNLLSMESGWNIIQTEEYAKQSLDFRRSCDLIAQAAEEKDIHRATLGYVALTVRCVECHSYMRRYEAEKELPDN